MDVILNKRTLTNIARLWLQWIFVTVSGFLISLYWVEIGFRPEIELYQTLIGGIVIGIAQWLILRQKIDHAWVWIIATGIAWLLIGSSLGTMGWIVPRTNLMLLRSLYGMIDGIKAGTILGIIQWIVLRRNVFHAWRWIVGNSAAWGIGLAMGWGMGAILQVRTGLFLGEVAGLIWGWVVIATITGGILVTLLPIQNPAFAQWQPQWRTLFHRAQCKQAR
jgi:hypothetical protein